MWQLFEPLTERQHKQREIDECSEKLSYLQAQQERVHCQKMESMKRLIDLYCQLERLK